MTFCLEDDNHKEVMFTEEILTFSLQLIKIWTTIRVPKNLKLFRIVVAVDINIVQQTFMVI